MCLRLDYRLLEGPGLAFFVISYYLHILILCKKRVTAAGQQHHSDQERDYGFNGHVC